jgi:pseudomonalisin
MVRPEVSSGDGLQPHFTNIASHYVTPNDFAVIFDVKQVYSGGINGAGQKVAIIGRSRVASTDISEYESEMGLTNNLPNVIIPTTGADPGTTNDGDQSEATLDVERLIGTAPGVQADLVVSSSASGGIFVAAQYEVQTVLDPVMTISFGSCEFYAGAANVSMWDTLFSQAASEGISVFVSSGDAGAAGCDQQFGTPPVYQILSINYICASSYATCVGGTEFAEGANATQYWSTTNGAGLVSALSYIPEGAWNEPQLNTLSFSYVVASGGGGASIYVPKPTWQIGTGVPADSARDVPDVSFPASFHDAYFGCFASGGGDCGANHFYYFYGTSAGTPSMAAVTALLNQKTGGSQGNLNPLLYRLAASNPSAFHDATPGTISGTVCAIGTASICNNSTPSANALTGGLAGYALTTGYDQATGLGSLDVANFLTAAAAVSKSTLASSTLSVQESASTIPNGQTVVFTATLTSKTAGAPTGMVQFYADGNAIGAPVAVASGTAVSAPVPFIAAGSYSISASYSGDGTYAAAVSAGIPLTVTGLTSVTAITPSLASIFVGSSESFNVAVSAGSGTGTPSGVVRVSITGPNTSILFSVPLVNGSATTPAITFPAAGSYTVTASYHGDTVFSPSTGTGPSIAVQRTPSVVELISSSPLPIGVGGAVSYQAIIQGTAPSTGVVVLIPAPTGQIQLYSNGVALGAPFSASSALGIFGFPQSPYNVFSTAGSYSITASFTGDSNWAPSTTNQPVTVTVVSQPATYSLQVASQAFSFAAGLSSNTDPISVTSQLGFVGTVSLSCSVTYNGTVSPDVPPTCSIPNGTAMLTPGPGLNTAVAITSTAATVARSLPGHSGFGLPAGWQGMAGVSVCGLMLWVFPVRRRSWRALGILMVFVAGFAALSGCGGSSNGSSGPPPVRATTPGSYTLTITPSSSVGAKVAPVTIALTIT